MTVIILTVFCLSGAAFLGCFFLALCREESSMQSRRNVEPLDLNDPEIAKSTHGWQGYEFSGTLGLRP